MSTEDVIRLGTRGSRLAVTQSQWVADLLSWKTGKKVELVKVTTHGDVNYASLAQVGGTGIFATELRQGLLRGDYDIVVHSFKDLPTAPEPGLSVAAVPVREDARDIVVTRTGVSIAELPEGARVGTGSPRRQAQVNRMRPELEVCDLRGNVDTRIGRLDKDLDAVILAGAGMKRLDFTLYATGNVPPILDAGRPDGPYAGRGESWVAAGDYMADATRPLFGEWLNPEYWITAPAQGALAIETRIGEESLVESIDDPYTFLTSSLERAVLAKLGAGCAAPVAVHADIATDKNKNSPGSVSVNMKIRIYGVEASKDIAADVILNADTSKFTTREAVAEWATREGGMTVVNMSAFGKDIQGVLAEAAERKRKLIEGAGADAD